MNGARVRVRREVCEGGKEIGVTGESERYLAVQKHDVAVAHLTDKSWSSILTLIITVITTLLITVSMTLDIALTINLVITTILTLIPRTHCVHAVRMLGGAHGHRVGIDKPHRMELVGV